MLFQDEAAVIRSDPYLHAVSSAVPGSPS